MGLIIENIELHSSSGRVALTERFPFYFISPLLISAIAHSINLALVCPLSELLQTEQKREWLLAKAFTT